MGVLKLLPLFSAELVLGVELFCDRYRPTSAYQNVLGRLLASCSLFLNTPESAYHDVVLAFLRFESAIFRLRQTDERLNYNLPGMAVGIGGGGLFGLIKGDLDCLKIGDKDLSEHSLGLSTLIVSVK